MLCRSRLRPRPAELPAQGYQGGGGKPPEAFARYTPPPRAGPGPLVVSSSFSCVLSSCGPSVGERHGGRSRRGKDEAPLGTVCDWWDIQGSAANSVCVYDPQADAWTQLASMVTARRLHASAAVGGKLYVFGGYTRVAPRGDSQHGGGLRPCIGQLGASDELELRTRFCCGGCSLSAGTVTHIFRVLQEATRMRMTCRCSCSKPVLGVVALCTLLDC